MRLRLSPLLCTRVTLIVGFLLTLAANLPGQLSWDSIWSLHAVENGVALGSDPPILYVFLRLCDRIIPGPSLYITAQITLYFACLLSLLQLRAKPSWWAVPGAMFLVASPLILVTQATLWHDVLFADLAVATFTALAWAGARWDSRTVRNIALGAAIFFGGCAALTRQNGIICVLALIVAIFIMACVHARRRAWRVALVSGGAAFLFIVAVNVGLSAQHSNSEYSGGLNNVQDFDITGVANIDPHVDLSILDHNDKATDAMIRSQAKTYSPDHLNYLATNSPVLWKFLSDQTNDVITAQWKSIIVHDTGAYLHHRLIVFSHTFLTPHIEDCLPLYVGVGGVPEWAATMGLRQGVRPQDQVIFNYGARFFHTPIYSHVFYAFLALALVVILLRRKRLPDLAVAAMLSSAILVASSYFIMSLSCDFRFLYFLDVSALAALLYYAADPSWLRE